MGGIKPHDSVLLPGDQGVCNLHGQNLPESFGHDPVDDFDVVEEEAKEENGNVLDPSPIQGERL